MVKFYLEGEKIMKKLLLVLVLIVGAIFTCSQTIGAKMNNNITEVRASHILVLDEQQAKDLKTKIDNNEISFEDAAKEYSQCPSKAQGGDLGYFGRGMMVKEFETAAFNGEVGKVTDPVQTQFGWHLIKVVDKR